MQSYKNLQERNSIYGSIKLANSQLNVLFPFKEHPIHGITGLHATEKYSEEGFVREYHYQWKIIIPKQGIRFSHITAWENEPHDTPDTSEEFKVATEPHHHHYIPGARKRRKENYNIRTLKAAFQFVAPYIESGSEYKP